MHIKYIIFCLPSATRERVKKKRNEKEKNTSKTLTEDVCLTTDTHYDPQRLLPYIYATDAITRAATPSSSPRTVIFVVTPDFDENAMRIFATTLPPLTVLPKSLRVCVLWLTGTSVPSSGCRERILASCSVASVYFC